MSILFYYLTEDPNNPKEQNEVEYLGSIGRVVMVTRKSSPALYLGSRVKNIHLSSQSPAVISTYFIWTKLCYLISRSSNSSSDKNFPMRNRYTGNTLVRFLINHIWSIKYFSFIKKLLPVYEDVYFAPFRLCRIFVRDKSRSNKRFQRVVVHDSLILRLTKFTPFILMARRCGFNTFANVKSWDNPFYSQFIRGASGYLTWSSNMWSDINQFHQISTSAHHVWGPRPFYSFATAVKQSTYKPNNMPGTIVIGYAAAFCDTLMAAHEVNVVVGIAKYLSASGLDVRILFRPYPILPISVYAPLQQCRNVSIIDIKGVPTDRYGDGREMIRFGSDEERIEYLSRCHFFLSIATSFTFEAVLFGLPVIQYFMPKNERNSIHELAFFERLDISDHILKYFLPYLPVASNCLELVSLVKKFQTDVTLYHPPLEMMAAIGFPIENFKWNYELNKLISNMRLG
jgi:hypothetical protein